MMRQYWVSKAAQEHVKVVQDKGYTQVNMGPRGPLEKMNPGDWILYYSPTVYYAQDEPVCHQFTGIACVNDQRVYPQGGLFPDRWRRNVEFFECEPIHVQHFVGKVTFLPEQKNWQDTLEESIFQITRDDFITIVEAIIIPTPHKILLF